MAGEGAEVGVKAGLSWSVEFEHFLLSGLDQLRVEEDVGAFRNVAFGHAIRSSRHLHGRHHDFVFHARLAEDDVVGLRDGVERTCSKKNDTRYNITLNLAALPRFFSDPMQKISMISTSGSHKKRATGLRFIGFFFFGETRHSGLA
jgi:hypothetical protein